MAVLDHMLMSEDLRVVRVHHSTGLVLGEVEMGRRERGAEHTKDAAGGAQTVLRPGVSVNVRDMNHGHVAECYLRVAELSAWGSGSGADASADAGDASDANAAALISAVRPQHVLETTLCGPLTDAALLEIERGTFTVVNMTGTSVDPARMAGPAAAALASKGCHLTSLILTGVSGLRHTALSGVVSDAVAAQMGPTLKILAARGCGFSGPIPLGIWKHCKRLQALDLSGNELEGLALPPHGAQPGHVYVASIPCLEHLDLSGNRSLCGRLAGWLSLCKRLVSIRMDGTQISGGPDVLKFTRTLKIVSINGSLIDGALPDTFDTHTRLETIDLTHNQLQGPIPATVDRLGCLRQLHLAENKLSGKIPKTLTACVKLEEIRLSDNLLEGKLPTKLVRPNSVSPKQRFLDVVSFATRTEARRTLALRTRGAARHTKPWCGVPAIHIKVAQRGSILASWPRADRVLATC